MKSQNVQKFENSELKKASTLSKNKYMNLSLKI